MTLVPRWLVRLAGGSPSLHRELAREARADELDRLQWVIHEDARRFEGAMASRAGRGPFRFGEVGKDAPYLIPFDNLFNNAAWVTGSTGSGKTRFAGAIVHEAIARILRGYEGAVICLDAKGGEDSLSDLALRSVAQLALQLDPRARQSLLQRLTTLRFHGPEYLVPFQILAPSLGLDPLAQGAVVAEILEAVVGRGIGARQESTLTKGLAGAISGRKNLVEFRYAIEDRGALAALLARSPIPEVRRDAGRIARESQSSIDGLASRVDLLLRSPGTKAMLAGEGALDFAPCFLPGAVTIIDASTSPALGAITLAYLTNALFAPGRRVRGKTLIVADEIQSAAMNPSNVRCLEKILTQGRSFGAAGLISCHQSVQQLPTEIRAMLSTNIALRVVGRSGADDARLAAEFLPRSGRVPKARLPGVPPPERPDFLSASEEERHHVEELSRLPRRHFLVADRREPFQPRIIRAASFDPPPLDRLPKEIVDAVLRGRSGRPRDELLRTVRELEERLLTGESSEADDGLAEPAATTPLRRRNAAATRTAKSARPLPDFPDLVSGRVPRTKRGGVP